MCMSHYFIAFVCIIRYTYKVPVEHLGGNKPVIRVTYPQVMTRQNVVQPLVEIAISRQTHIVKHWTTTQHC